MHALGHVIDARIEDAELRGAAIALDARHLACIRGEVAREHADPGVGVDNAESGVAA